MKIDVVTMTRRKDFEGPITVNYETIRVPSYVKILERETVEKILEERVERIRKLKEYWEEKMTENNTNPFLDDHSNRILVSWSPIITADALNFICQKF